MEKKFLEQIVLNDGEVQNLRKLCAEARDAACLQDAEKALAVCEMLDNMFWTVWS